MATQGISGRRVLTLDTPQNGGDGVRRWVIALTASDETVFRCGPNCSGYRGTSHQPTSWALGLCLTGVKEEPTVNRNPYRYVNVGSAVIGFARHAYASKAGSAATEVRTAWRSGGSSRRRGTPCTWQSTAVIARDDGG